MNLVTGHLHADLVLGTSVEFTGHHVLSAQFPRREIGGRRAVTRFTRDNFRYFWQENFP
jgi:hypothetical protein